MSNAQSLRRRWPGEGTRVVVGLAFALLYVFVITYQPLALLADAALDDGTYIVHGRSLAEGRWLGSFNWLTLRTGPGYPLFLAINFWLGLPITLTHAIFFCGALGLFSWAIKSISRSGLIGLSSFVLILWHPVFLGTQAIRDTIYAGQLFLVFACALVAFFIAEKLGTRVLWGALTGLALGWFWLTREEGIWILPAAAFLLLFAIVRTHLLNSSLRNVAIPAALTLVLFLLVHFAFMSGNWLAYGSFVGVDIKERNFVAALDALQSVQYGPHVDYLPVPRVVRERIYEVSPSFASVKPLLDPPQGPVWHGCRVYPATCGDIAGGWFIWALRDAAAQAGHYRTPGEASAFFGRLVSEVNEACRSGQLSCRGSPIPYMPRVSWLQIEQIPQRIAEAVILVSRPAQLIHLDSTPSSGELSDALDFLNHPAHNLPQGYLQRVRLSGWYYSKDGIWPRFDMQKPDGQSVPITLQFYPSPDIASHFGDTRAASNRFILETNCSPDCTLSIKRGDGTELRPSLRALLGVGPITGGGDGTFNVDRFQTESPTRSDIRLRVSRLIRQSVLAAYDPVLPYALGFGAVAFVGAVMLGSFRRSGGMLLAVAATVWILLVSRIILLVLIDISSFPALELNYLTPALYLSVTAAVLSLASLASLARKSVSTGRQSCCQAAMCEIAAPPRVEKLTRVSEHDKLTSGRGARRPDG